MKRAERRAQIVAEVTTHFIETGGWLSAPEIGGRINATPNTVRHTIVPVPVELTERQGVRPCNNPWKDTVPVNEFAPSREHLAALILKGVRNG
jgi:hypothetical protein